MFEAITTSSRPKFRAVRFRYIHGLLCSCRQFSKLIRILNSGLITSALINSILIMFPGRSPDSGMNMYPPRLFDYVKLRTSKVQVPNNLKLGFWKLTTRMLIILYSLLQVQVSNSLSSSSFRGALDSRISRR